MIQPKRGAKYIVPIITLDPQISYSLSDVVHRSDVEGCKH